MTTFDEKATPAREAAILAAARAGDFTHTWATVKSEARGHTATVRVSADALKVGDVRVTTNAETCQAIADHLGASLCTTRIADLAWDLADIRIPPCLQTPDAHMSDWSRTVQHSLEIDRRMAAGFLARNVGKYWVLTNRLKRGLAANYGWFDSKSVHTSWSGYRVWQPLGTAHNTKHVDYSQTVQLMAAEVVVDGVARSVTDVLHDADLCWLLSDEGVMRVTRVE